MKKQLLFSTVFFLSLFLNAQVGINTETPETTLDIKADNPSNPDSSTGILIPRVTANPTTGKENGQMIFNTTDGLFYFWNGTIWSPIFNQSNSLNSNFKDTRSDSAISMNQDSAETLIPGAVITFSLTQQTPVQFNSTVNFEGISSAFSPLFKLKLTNLNTNNSEFIDQVSNTYLSDGIDSYFGNLALFTIKNLSAGNYKAEVIASYNACCKYDFMYEVGGVNTPVSLLIEYNN